MQFGYFDDTNKEYVITNPETPAPWSNYLGSTVYGAIITNNAGGYSFYKSAAQGRFTRYRTNAIPLDQPGRYIYIRDQESGDYWSSSWQPVAKPLNEYKSVCRHGTAYTVIESEYSGILTETIYFVPHQKEFEYWRCKIVNKSKQKRILRLFTFVEYAGNWQLWQDIVNLQYSQYILTMNLADNIIDHGTNVFLPAQPDNFEEGGQARHTFLGVAGVKITGFDTDRKVFLGTFGSYSKPAVVEKGQCSGSLASGDNGCGVLQFDIELEPQSAKDFTVIMGVGAAAVEGSKAMEQAQDIKKVDEELNRLKKIWHGYLENITADTPDSEFNSMINVWNPYNCLITYAWSRAASLVYAGERDGLGFRDTVQDIMGVLPVLQDGVTQRIELMLTGQFSNGGAMPVVKPFSHKPGQMKAIDDNEYRSDDALWLFNTVPAYIKETGDIEFLFKVLPYADTGEDSVLQHLRKAIEFSLDHTGKHGLPCGLAADWNDCLVLGSGGESVFVAFQLRYALKSYIEICTYLNMKDEISWAAGRKDILDRNIETHAWDTDHFIRAFREDGLRYGAGKDEEGSLWLNPQIWSIISEHTGNERSGSLLNLVFRRLFTEYGLMICDPPYEKADLSVIKATLFNKGMKENGAVFCHTQGWAVIAETMNNNGNRAHQYFRACMPAAMNTRAEIREAEPYVYCQSTHSKYSSRFGASRLPWLTGAASWAYYAAVQYILGIRPGFDGLTIDPCIPDKWPKCSIRKIFRGRTVQIEVVNKYHKKKGIAEIILNSEQIKGTFIPYSKLKNHNIAKVVI